MIEVKTNLLIGAYACVFVGGFVLGVASSKLNYRQEKEDAYNHITRLLDEVKKGDISYQEEIKEEDLI